jgi:hypothetical protein
VGCNITRNVDGVLNINSIIVFPGRPVIMNGLVMNSNRKLEILSSDDGHGVVLMMTGIGLIIPRFILLILAFQGL